MNSFDAISYFITYLFSLIDISGELFLLPLLFVTFFFLTGINTRT